MKVFKGVVITTYQEKITVWANTKEEAEVLMYDKANPVGDSVNGEMEVFDLIEIGTIVDDETPEPEEDES